MKQIFELFKAPNAEQVARQLLAKAKRDLLATEAQREHATLVAAFQRGLITRLTNQINSGELGELV